MPNNKYVAACKLNDEIHDKTDPEGAERNKKMKSIIGKISGDWEKLVYSEKFPFEEQEEWIQDFGYIWQDLSANDLGGLPS